MGSAPAEQKKSLKPPIAVGNFNAVDIVKFILPFLVLVGHIPPFRPGFFPHANDLNYWIQKGLARLVVPFYFLCAGFFLFRKMELPTLDTDRIRNYCFKILRLLGTWTVFLFVGGSGHMWNFGSSVVAIIVVSLCISRGMKWWVMYVLAIGLYFLGLFGDTYYGVIPYLPKANLLQRIMNGYEYFFSTTRNGVFMGFLYILIGAHLSQRNYKMKPVVALLGLIASAACMCVEVAVLRRHHIPKDYNMYIFAVPTGLFIFLLTLNLNLKDRKIYRTLRDVGMLMYFIHLVVYYITDKLLKIVGGALDVSLVRYRCLLTIVFALGLAVILERMSHKEKHKWIKWFMA